jgi:hypothetical protein
MVDRHPITPPPGLVRKWLDLPLSEEEIVVTAYRAGADRELEACCEWLCTLESNAAVNTDRRLRAARRPKALGLKEQALDALGREEADSCSPHNLAIIRRALEALPND